MQLLLTEVNSEGAKLEEPKERFVAGGVYS